MVAERAIDKGDGDVAYNIDATEGIPGKYTVGDDSIVWAPPRDPQSVAADLECVMTGLPPVKLTLIPAELASQILQCEISGQELTQLSMTFV